MHEHPMFQPMQVQRPPPAACLDPHVSITSTITHCPAAVCRCRTRKRGRRACRANASTARTKAAIEGSLLGAAEASSELGFRGGFSSRPFTLAARQRTSPSDGRNQGCSTAPESSEWWPPAQGRRTSEGLLPPGLLRACSVLLPSIEAENWEQRAHGRPRPYPARAR